MLGNIMCLRKTIVAHTGMLEMDSLRWDKKCIGKEFEVASR